MSNPFEKYLEASQRQYANHEYNLQVVRELMPQIEPVKSLEGSFPKSKTLNDYAGDTAVDATKAAMTLAQTGISALDLGAYSLGGLGSSVLEIGHAIAPETIAKPVWNEYGLVTKALDDGLGFNINKAKQGLGELGYSDIRKEQEAELHTGYSKEEIEAFKNQWTNEFSLQYQDLANKGANPLQLEAFKSKFEGNYKKAYAQFMDKYQTSWDKPLGENLDIIGHAFGKVMDNPSLGAGAAIESTGYLFPSLAVSRGVAALQGAAKASAFSKAVAAGTGEGLVSALALNEQMRGNSATGTIDGTKVAAGFAGGAVTGLIGGVSNRLGSRFGLDDIDSLSLGTQAKGFSVTKPVLATAQEGGEEFLQGFGESIIPNIAEGKDPLQGLAQELALGTAAGGVMGAATNARSLVSGAGGDLVAGFNKVAEAVGKGKDAITAKTFEELNDPANKAYDPAKAFNSQVPKTNSQDGAEREQALANMESVFTNLETHKGNLINEKGTAQGILKNIAALPPEEQAKNLKAKGQAEKLVKDLDARIIAADNQVMDLFEQKLTLGKNQEVQAGVPQYSEEQAKADIEVLSQAPASTAVWATEDNDGNALNIPVTITGTPVVSNGYETVEVKYTDSTGKERTTYAPTSALVQDTATQQEAAQRITKHFSKLSLDELDTVAKSPYLSEEQRNSLRYLSETKRAIADMADTGTVTRHILNGLKGKTAAESHRGLNNYTEMVNTAINTKDEKLLNIALDDLGRFAQDHTDKANALVEAYQLAVSGKFPNLQVLRPKNGTWGIVTDPNKFVDDVKLKATGGLNVHRNSNIKGSIDAVTKEAALIQDSLKALTQVGLSFGLQAVEPTVTAPVSTETLKEANKPVTTSAQNTTDIYSKLPPKSISGNVLQQSWDKLKTATKAIYDKAIISTRIPNSTEHFGNPFSSDARVLANNPELIKTNSTKESVEKYIDWVINSQDTRAKWIREQIKSGGLKGKQILYYTELNEPSHANALDYLINEYVWDTDNKPTPNQEVDTPTPKVGETSIEVKGRFTITKTVVSDNTVLSVHTNNDNGEVTKSEYATTYSDIYTDEYGDAITLVIYRDSKDPSVITDVESFDPKDKKNSIGSYGEQGNQTDEKFITTFTEAIGVTLEYTNKFEKSLPVVKPKTPDTSTQTEATATVATPSQVPPVNVWAGSNENTKLSNLATRPFTFGGKKYQSVEHAYQTLKSGDFDQQTYDKYAGTKNKKIAGNRGTNTTDNANIRLMEKLMTASFEQNKDAMELLQKTGDTLITHTQDKSIWGKEFPRILMEIRENNKTTPKPNQEVSKPATSTQAEATEAVNTEPVVAEEVPVKQEQPVVDTTNKVDPKTTDQSQVLTELNLSATQIQDVTSDLKNHVSFETVNTNTNRQTAQLGSDYTYSGKTYEGQPIPTHIQAWMDAVNKALGTAFNSVLVQYYPANTKSGIGFHKDNEKDQFDTNQPVISLSIGQTIPFIVHEKINTPVTFSLKSGDVFKFNGNKLHGIATQNHTGERYSLTLRQFHTVKVHKTTPPKQTAPVVETKAEPIIPETVEGLVKEYGYLGELLADEDVDKVFKQEVEKILKIKADRASKGDPTFVSFNDLLAFNGGIEYFTRLAKDDPNIIKLTKAAYKLRNLMRIVQHLSVLNNYHHGDRSINLKEYLNKYPELKSIFTEAKEQNTRNILMSVIGDIQEAKDVLSTEMDKLITLVGLFYIRAAFEKGQQYLIDTNYADLSEVLYPFTLGLLSNKHLGHLQKNRVVGDDSKGVRELITPTELAFLDKIDGVPVGELSKEDFEMVKALVQNRVNSYFNQYEVLEYPRRPEKVYSQIVHDIIVEHIPKEGFDLENFTPEEVIKGAVPQSFIWDFKKQSSTPIQNTTPPVEAATAEGTTDVSEAPNTKETQTSDDAEALIEALETEAKKRVTLGDEDTLEAEALSELVSLAYGDAITTEDLETVKQLFGEDLVNEAERIRNLPLSKRDIAQNYLEQIRLLVGGHIKVKLYVKDLTLEDLELYKEKALYLAEKRGRPTTKLVNAFSVMADYVNSLNVEDKTSTEPTKDTTQESGDNNTGAIIEDTTSTGQGSGEATTVTNQAEVEDGKVTVLQGVTEEVREEERSKPFSVRNLIKAYFTQKKGDASNSPLVLVKDFINQSDLLTQVGKYLSNKTKVTDARINQLLNFKEFRNKLAPVIQDEIAREFKKDPKNNLLRYLLNPTNNKLDENTVTAIALAAYGYLLRYGTAVSNTDEDIKHIVRMKKDSALPKAVAEYLRYMGQEAPYVEYELGKQISQMLGLKVMKDGGVKLQDRLDKAFGNIVTASLHNVGYVVIDTSVNPKVLGAMLETAAIDDENVSFEEGSFEGGVDTIPEHPISKMNKMTFIRINYDVLGGKKRNWVTSTIGDGETITETLEYAVLKPKTGTVNGEVTYALNELAWSTDITKTVPNDAKNIVKLSEGTGAFLNTLFGVDVGYSMPQIEETQGLLSKVKQATKTVVSKLQASLIGEAQTRNVFTLRNNTVQVLRSLQGIGDNSKFLKELLGIWVDDYVLARTYVDDRDSLMAKATNEWAALENGLSWADAISLGEGTYADFYDTQYIAQNERQHYNSNLFNMQTSLIHRAMGTLKAFSVKISFDSVSTDGNYQRFLQAVGEGLEGLDGALKDTIKSFTPMAQFFTVDKVSGEIYTYALQQYLAQPNNLAAIEAMASVIEGNKPTRQQRNAIANFVKAGDMGIQSLQSLIALAEMQVAINKGETSFTTSIGLGSDGVNNGVATANLLTGVITRGMQKQVGMLPTEADTSVSTMQEVYAKGMPDYYISFGQVMGYYLNKIRSEEVDTDFEWREALQALFPTYKAIQIANIEMRKIAKVWSIPFNYGAGIVSLQRALSNGFMGGVIKQITSINNQALEYKKEYETVITEVDTEQEKAQLTTTYNLNIKALSSQAESLEFLLNKVLRRDTPQTDVYGKPKTAYNFELNQVVPVYVNKQTLKLPRVNGAIDVFALNDYSLDTRIVDSLKSAAQSVHGVAAWDATKTYAKDYTKARDTLNSVNSSAYEFYANLRNTLIENKINQKIDEKLAEYGGLQAFNKHNADVVEGNKAITQANRALPKGATKQDLLVGYPTKERDNVISEVRYLGLNAEELQEIDEVLASVRPIIHSPLSSKSGNINSGISLVTTKTAVTNSEVGQQVNTAYPDYYGKAGLENKASLPDDVEEAAGIKVLALAVQGMDAYVASYVQAKYEGINVHDAYIFGVDQFVEGTKYQNEIYLDGISKYHMGTAHAEAFVRSFLGLQSFIQAIDSLNLSDEAKVALKEETNKQMLKAVFGSVHRNTTTGEVIVYVNPKTGEEYLKYSDKVKGIYHGLKDVLPIEYVTSGDVQGVIEVLIDTLSAQDLAKLETLKNLQAVHQYSGDGGAYVIGKGGDITEAKHLENIEAQIKLVELKKATLLKSLTNAVKTFELSKANKNPQSEMVKFLETNKGVELDIEDVLTILKAVPASAKSEGSFQQQLAIIREIAPLLDGVKVIYEDVANNEEEGIDDYVPGFYNEDTNRITIRANFKYPPTAKLVLHELLHSGLAARITYLQNLPKDSEEYQDARVALQRLESLRKEILSNLVEGVDASKYFELEAAFKDVGGWEAYKKAQESLKNNKEYQGALTRIKTLKTLLKEALQKRKEQNTQFTTLNSMYEEYSEALKNIPFNTDEYSKVWLQQQDTLDAIKQLKEDQQKNKEAIAAINLQLKKADAIVTDKESAELVTVKTAKAFLKLHNTLKNTVFTINGTTEINGLTVVNQLIDIHEFISYGLTEQYLQDIMEAVVQVKNTAERKGTGLRGYLGIFVKAIARILKIGKGETIDALSAFAMDVANTIKAIRESNVPRAESTTPTIRKSTATQAEDQVNQMSSIEVMQTLPHTGNADFGLHLNNLAEKVISQVYNNDEVAKAEIDVIQAIRALPAIKAGFNLSQREAAIQHSLELVLQTYLETSKGGLNVGQLWKIYAEAQKNIKVSDFYDGDWSKATAQEVAATQQKYNYVINSSGKGVESLARFISMGLATEEVHNLLGFNTVTAKPSKQKSWFDTLNGWVRYIAAWLGNKLVKTSPLDPAYKQLQGLVNNLTALDIRNRQAVVSIFDKAWNLVGKATAPLDKAAQKLRQYATNRDFLRKSKYLPLRTLGSIASLDAKAMGETIPALIREARDKARPNEKLGEAMTALMESTAMSSIRKSMEALIRQANLNAKDRQDKNDNVKKAIMAWFKDNGKHISKAMHKAITYTLLRTDAQSLLTTFGLDKTIGLLLDTNKLKNEIDLVTKDISQYKNGNSMINQAMRLAYYMVTNKGGMSLSKNPTAIAIGLGTNYQVALEDVDQALVGQLDVLASLFAMKYTSAKDRKVLGEMYKENPEALHGLLNMHKGFMADAETEFKDNPLNYIKGWMPEIVNPYREVRAASGIDERDQMLKEGWKVIEEIKPHGKFLMVHADIGYQRLVSGAVDLQNSHRKGTEIVNRQSKQYLSTVKANLAYSAHIASIPHTQFDPSKQETGLIPTYDTDGVPMAFNYEMASWVRDKEMERNNNFADLMGSYAGAMFYKPAKRNQSVVVANVLFEDYKQNYQKHPNSYIKLSGKSSDPRIVEMWRMLPKDFRQRATELYGKGEPIIINNEAFLLAFGFKKWSITNIWNKPESERTHMETMFVHMAEGILGDTAKAKIAKAGHIWTEAVSKAKDFIVIRSISVLWNNVIANGLMLMAHNINPITIGKEWTFATTNVRAYQTLNSELIQLKANTLAGKGNSATEAQIKRIESQLEANPMSRYINAGLLSSIVEDVTIQQGDYSYDSELKKKIDNVTGWLPDSVKTLGAWAVFSPSTKAYQFLATTTQLSDFVAKVTLAKHLESKGMDFKAAVSEASQTFINYDVPQGVGMQYMNDMGLFMFTKFFLRIQAVLFKLMDKKAATVLAQHIATESLTDMQGILGPMALARIGNWPFEEGAASIIGAAMSIAPVNAGLGLAGF